MIDYALKLLLTERLIDELIILRDDYPEADWPLVDLLATLQANCGYSETEMNLAIQSMFDLGLIDPEPDTPIH